VNALFVVSEVVLAVSTALFRRVIEMSDVTVIDKVEFPARVSPIGVFFVVVPLAVIAMFVVSLVFLKLPILSPSNGRPRASPCAA
jgi:hypothetical protein